MTSQTRHFIELSDVIAMRFECKHCRASLELGMKIEQGTLHHCPSCHRDWALVNTDGPAGASYEQVFVKFIESINALNVAAKAPIGFSMTLEIKPVDK
jgi:hypothetical protein